MSPRLPQIVKDALRGATVRHVHWLAHKIGEIEWRIAGMQPQILCQKDTDHIVERFAIHRVPGVSLASQNLPHLLLGGFDIERDDFRSRPHDIPGFFLVKV